MAARATKFDSSLPKIKDIYTIPGQDRYAFYDGKFWPWPTASDDEPLFAVVGQKRILIARASPREPITTIHDLHDVDVERNPGHPGLNSCAWGYANPAQPLLIVAGGFGIIKVVDVLSGKRCKLRIQHVNASINDIAVHHCYPWIFATASQDGQVRVWDLRPCFSPLRVSPIIICGGGIDGHRAGVLSVSWHKSGRYLVTGGFDHSVCVWTLPDLGKRSPFWASIDPKRIERHTSEAMMIYYPHLITKAIHSNYVDCVKFLGDFIVSKAATENKIVLWKITGFDSSKSPPTSMTAVKAGAHLDTRNGFMRTVITEKDGTQTVTIPDEFQNKAPYERLLELDAPYSEAFYMRFAVLSPSRDYPYSRLMIAYANGASELRFWDLDRLCKGHDHPPCRRRKHGRKLKRKRSEPELIPAWEKRLKPEDIPVLSEMPKFDAIPTPDRKPKTEDLSASQRQTRKRRALSSINDRRSLRLRQVSPTVESEDVETEWGSVKIKQDSVEANEETESIEQECPDNKQPIISTRLRKSAARNIPTGQSSDMKAAHQLHSSTLRTISTRSKRQVQNSDSKTHTGRASTSVPDSGSTKPRPNITIEISSLSSSRRMSPPSKPNTVNLSLHTSNDNPLLSSHAVRRSPRSKPDTVQSSQERVYNENDAHPVRGSARLTPRSTSSSSTDSDVPEDTIVIRSLAPARPRLGLLSPAASEIASDTSTVSRSSRSSPASQLPSPAASDTVAAAERIKSPALSTPQTPSPTPPQSDIFGEATLARRSTRLKARSANRASETSDATRDTSAFKSPAPSQPFDNLGPAGDSPRSQRIYLEKQRIILDDSSSGSDEEYYSTTESESPHTRDFTKRRIKSKKCEEEVLDSIEVEDEFSDTLMGEGDGPTGLDTEDVAPDIPEPERALSATQESESPSDAWEPEAGRPVTLESEPESTNIIKGPPTLVDLPAMTASRLAALTLETTPDKFDPFREPGKRGSPNRDRGRYTLDNPHNPLKAHKRVVLHKLQYKKQAPFVARTADWSPCGNWSLVVGESGKHPKDGWGGVALLRCRDVPDKRRPKDLFQELLPVFEKIRDVILDLNDPEEIDRWLNQHDVILQQLAEPSQFDVGRDNLREMVSALLCAHPTQLYQTLFELGYTLEELLEGDNGAQNYPELETDNEADDESSDKEGDDDEEEEKDGDESNNADDSGEESSSNDKFENAKVRRYEDWAIYDFEEEDDDTDEEFYPAQLRSSRRLHA
ncbi:hypothetical protein AYO20_06562 [Fonsecaea nubica]|uniref:Uncharacterized protein n=1 Tax=Fonsecaea nubica TaxID=856822 RepID=A0A178CXH3_9EURO|nr:hypothetical protein AYO20_06562 [Fonsecaea nubica]OAL34107.1 hypothetical protein AYO20_06562 [Fonsecaea nubica]